MGRNSKIRQQRKHSALTEIPLARRCLPTICQGILFITETLPKQPRKHILLGKIAASLKPFPKVGKYQPGMDAHAFSEENQFCGCERLGGLSAGERTGVSSKLWLFTSQISTSRASCSKNHASIRLSNRRHTRYGQHDWGVWANK